MGTASIPFDTWSLAWRNLCSRLSSDAGRCNCVHRRKLHHRLGFGNRGVSLEGVRYCVERCLESALADALLRFRAIPQRAAASHRVPLGLLLLSRQQLTAEQLQLALETQRAQGHGKIGEWLQNLGFVNEQQVTAGLARQWSCPVLRASSPVIGRAPQLPLSLLEHFRMIPLQYVESTSTLHMAFGESVDYSVLYAIERMIGCHTEACMAVPSFIRSHLQKVTEHRGESELIFERISDHAEASRIVRSYCARVAASEIRIASCEPYVWIRLLRNSRAPLDLLLASQKLSGL